MAYSEDAWHCHEHGCRPAFCDVKDEDGHVDDLGAADDGADQAGVPRAVHQRELDLIEGLLCHMLRQRHLRSANLSMQCTSGAVSMGLNDRGCTRPLAPQWSLHCTKHSCPAPAVHAHSALQMRGCEQRKACRLTVKDEKPRSRVIPRSLLWGCLSRAAVESFVDRAATGKAATNGMRSRDWWFYGLGREGGKLDISSDHDHTEGCLARIDMAQDSDIDVPYSL